MTSTHQYSRELAACVAAAREAGALLRRAFSQEKQILSEKGRDIKLQADQDAERIILEGLGLFNYPVLAEESGEHGDLAGGGLCWIVDPLDGTMNFARGIPICCVSIALCRGETPVAGVIHDFNRDECYTGVVGAGAWLNDVPMRVSQVDAPASGILSSGFPVNYEYKETSLRDYTLLAKQFKKIRMFGSAALSLAYVAAGRVDAYMEDEIMLWDIAAGIALVEAAGGYVEVAPSSRVKWARRVRAASRKSLWHPPAE